MKMRRHPVGARASKRLLRWPSRNYFAEVEPRPDQIHPVDALMDRDRDLNRLRRRARRLLARVQATPTSDALLDFEAARNDLDTARTEVAFNIGFECGRLTGLTEGLRRSRGGKHAAAERRLSADVRAVLTGARVQPRRALMLLLELAWSLSAAST
jgi:hypothetical protein